MWLKLFLPPKTDKNEMSGMLGQLSNMPFFSQSGLAQDSQPDARGFKPTKQA